MDPRRDARHASAAPESAPLSAPAGPLPANGEGRCESCRVRLVAVCAALQTDELSALEAISEPRTLPPRRTLFQQGDAVDSVFTVTAGTVRLQSELSDGRRQVVGFAIGGDFLGLALANRYGFSAETLTPATVCRFARRDFARLVEKHPALLSRLHAVASHELGIAQAHMVVLGRRRAEERVAAFLLRWRARLRALNGASSTVPLPMGRQDIADHLGLTIETVSRVFARWMRQRIVLGVPDGVRVLDEDRLAALVAD